MRGNELSRYAATTVGDSLHPAHGLHLVLLFPFYWMGVTTFKPNEELYNFSDHNPFWITSPTLDNIRKLLFETDYPQWLLNTMTMAACATFSVHIRQRPGRLRDYPFALPRRSDRRVAHLSRHLVPPSILFIPLAILVYGLRRSTIRTGPNSRPTRPFSFRSARGC